LLFSATTVCAQVNPGQETWGPAPAVFPKGAQMSLLAGDPTKPGVFVIRLKMPAGYRIPPHHHPTDEYVTVISGDLGLGMGDKFDPARGAALAPGGFAQAGAGMNHYAWSKNGAVVQVSAVGPFAMTYVNPADDPTR
jgi:quercetin dioxygenase-like cupin family protein